MNISDIVTTEYVEFSPDDPVSKLVGAFDDPRTKAVVVVDDGAFTGVVTRRQITASHRPPTQKVRSLVWRVPTVEPTEDVRRVARLMLDSDSRLLPVFEGERMVGVVEADDLLGAVESFLDVATVSDVYTADPVTVPPDATVGHAINHLRSDGFSHLPVVAGDDPVGIVSLHDLAELSARAVRSSSGGRPTGVDAPGGEMSLESGRTHGGFGAREGESDRVMDLPIRTVMSDPVRTIGPDERLDVAVERMFDAGASSLVVTSDGGPFGIVTKSDLLRALTREAPGNRPVQIYGSDLIDDMSYDDILAMVEGFDDKSGEMSVLDAKIHLHEHDEKHRGTPLLLARIRLYTDRGLFIASGEGYGAGQAVRDARDALERQIRKEKEYERTKKHPGDEYWEKRFGWQLEQ